MGDVALVAAKIAPVYTDPGMNEHYMVEIGETVTPGQALYWVAAGEMMIAETSGPKMEVQAVALQGGLAGQVISVLRRGYVYGFTVAAINTGTVVCLSTTAGAFETGGASTVYCGRVVALPDTTRVIYFDFLVRDDYS